ncbi:DBH-like monooxygenase protein 2 isoform X2 [Crassostrea virginica]
MLLSEPVKVALPADITTRDLLNKRFLVPDVDTFYLCRVFDVSDLGKKHHLIKYEPVIQKGHEGLVHHMLLHKCSGVDRKYVGVNFDCYHSHNDQLRACSSTIVSWAVGGGEFYYPPEAGLPLGEVGDNDLLILETHYNNPGVRNDFVDNSGVRLHLTPTLRQYDAGILYSGVGVQDLQIIPPFDKEFESSGFCTAECLNKGLAAFPDGVNIIAVLLHGHLLTRKIRTRLIRNGTELEPLAVDDNYDFNFQDFRTFPKPRKLMSGDSLIVQCSYDSSKQTNVTYGGLATTDEMCLSFMIYYPRMPLEMCESIPMYNMVPRAESSSGRAVAAQFDFTSQSVRNHFKMLTSTTNHWAQCIGDNKYSHQVLPMLVPKVPYVEPPSTCSKTSSQPLTTPSPKSHPCQSPTPSEDFDFKEKLDSEGKYVLFWNNNKTHITFEIHVETKGYIGFGLSPNGKMYPADVIVGWVKDGVPHFKDRHTTGHSQPLVDASQDWHLLYAREDHCRTVMKVVRKLDTCDDQDYKITDDTVKIIYSYHPHDPVSDDVIPYHGAHRGIRSLLLLSKISPPTLETDAVTIDILNNHYHVPAADTTYSCRVFDLSYLQKKHHLVKFEVVVEKGHDVLVHHMVLYKCPGLSRDLINSPNYICHEDKSKEPCSKIVALWAVGGEAFYFPEEAGFPVAEPGDTELYIMETHYNNPERRADFVDNSGFRLTVTPTLRAHDAAIISVQSAVDKSQVIPPHQPNFVTTAYCNQSTLQQYLQEFPNGVKVIGVQQHAHLLGKAIKTRLIRGGVEQKPLADDRYYDFNYQDFRRANRTLKAGDSIIVECTYDSTGRDNITYGGYSTHEEMCISFIFYYPRSRLLNCQTKPLYDRFHTETKTHWWSYLSPLNGTFDALDWTKPSVVQKLKDSLQHDSFFYIYGHDSAQYNYTFGYPKDMLPTVPYTEPTNANCVV